MRGDPHFEAFLHAVETAKQEMEASMEDFENIGNHAVLAFIAGRVGMCREILQAGRPFDGANSET